MGHRKVLGGATRPSHFTTLPSSINAIARSAPGITEAPPTPTAGPSEQAKKKKKKKKKNGQPQNQHHDERTF
jgi:hypothetical protein